MSIEKIRTSILVAAAAAAIAVGGLMAGRVSAQAFRERPRGEFATRIFARMARTLDLTDDQKARIKDVLRAHADEIKAQMQASGDARRALHDAVMAPQIDESAVRTAAMKVGQVQGDGAVLFARLRTDIEPILTDAQKAKVQSLREKVRQHGQSATQAFDNFLKNGS